jgi:hypothetical protein
MSFQSKKSMDSDSICQVNIYDSTMLDLLVVDVAFLLKAKFKNKCDVRR